MLGRGFSWEVLVLDPVLLELELDLDLGLARIGSRLRGDVIQWLVLVLVLVLGESVRLGVVRVTRT